MSSLKKDFEREVRHLKGLIDENENLRKEIRDLRENLFSGTSVLESRKSVEQTEITVQQGQNIKLLTLVNIFFLPLTFVTSVFGMTNMNPDAGFWRFGVTMATVCVPFFLLIGSMNTSRGMQFWTEQAHKLFSLFWSCFTWWRQPTLRSRTNSMSTESGEEKMRKIHGRSLSAREGILERTTQFADSEEPTPNPPPRRTISFGPPISSPPSDQKTLGDPTAVEKPNPEQNISVAESSSSNQVTGATSTRPWDSGILQKLKNKGKDDATEESSV
jgi:hypothetical protein